MEIGSILQASSNDKYLPSGRESVFRLPFMKDPDYFCSFYQSGRNAIEVLFREIAEKENVLVPDFVCATVPEAIIRAGCTPVCYHIEEDLSFNPDEIAGYQSLTKLLYVVHFFGRKMSESEIQAIRKWKENGGIVIEDITMSLYSDASEAFGFGDYIIGSIRKWLPIADGGLIISKIRSFAPPVDSVVSLYSNYYQIAQILKREYINSKESDKELKDTYLKFYQESIRYLFSDYSIRPISPLSMNYILNTQDNASFSVRVENYKYLFAKLQNLNTVSPVVQLEEGFVPFGMVVKCERRDELLQNLIKNDIYCNVHWRLDFPSVSSLSKNIMTIPCDERYNRSDMDRIVEAIENFYK